MRDQYDARGDLAAGAGAAVHSPAAAVLQAAQDHAGTMLGSALVVRDPAVGQAAWVLAGRQLAVQQGGPQNETGQQAQAALQQQLAPARDLQRQALVEAEV